MAIRLKPDYAAYYNRGIARSDEGDMIGSIEDYNEATRLKPDFAPAFINRGVSRSAIGDRDGAIVDYAEAIRLQPDYAAFYNRGRERELKGDLEGALQDFEEAIRLKPDDAEAIASRDALLKAMAEASKDQAS